MLCFPFLHLKLLPNFQNTFGSAELGLGMQSSALSNPPLHCALNITQDALAFGQEDALEVHFQRLGVGGLGQGVLLARLCLP